MLVSAILSQLITNETYSRIVLPHLESDYFVNQPERIVFEVIRDFVRKYNALPTIESIKIDLHQSGKINSQQLKTEVDRVLSDLKPQEFELDWAIHHTETFCQERAIENALYKAVGILEDKEENSLDKGMIPSLLSDALAVSFDNHIGHDYFEDWLLHYDYLHRNEERLPFDIEELNIITNDGLPRKTFTVLLGGTGGGKTLTMCHMSANNLKMGKNVLYITLEMSEDQIRERIDANLLEIDIKMISKLPRTTYEAKIEKLQKKTPGRLIIKEYPTASAGADNFRHLIHELKIKKKFVPDIIYVDYLNICKSSRVKMGNSINTYLYVKFIAEELRGLAVENNVPMVTGSQTNREGLTSSDPGMEHVSDSLGTAMTADLMIVVYSTDEMRALNQLGFKQVKNRFNDLGYYTKFFVGCNRSQMKLYNLEKRAQPPHPDGAVFDRTSMGNAVNDSTKKKFGQFK